MQLERAQDGVQSIQPRQLAAPDQRLDRETPAKLQIAIPMPISSLLEAQQIQVLAPLVAGPPVLLSQ